MIQDGVVWRSDGRVEGETYKAPEIQDPIGSNRIEHISATLSLNTVTDRGKTDVQGSPKIVSMTTLDLS